MAIIQAGNDEPLARSPCTVGVLHTGYWVTLLVVVRPYDRLTVQAAQVNVAECLFERLPLEWILYCLVLGSAVAYDFYERYREGALQAAQLETSLADARLHALELQIQPHFLFNTMNAISSLVRNRRNSEAVAMMTGLSELLRYTLDHERAAFRIRPNRRAARSSPPSPSASPSVGRSSARASATRESSPASSTSPISRSSR